MHFYIRIYFLQLQLFLDWVSRCYMKFYSSASSQIPDLEVTERK